MTVKELIHGVMNDELGGKKYTVEAAEVWTKNIATAVRNKVKGMWTEMWNLFILETMWVWLCEGRLYVGGGNLLPLLQIEPQIVQTIT